MTSTQCFRCGRVNSSDSIACQGCGETLLRGQEYEQRFQELRDYHEFRKRYSILRIALVVLVLLLLCPLVAWLAQIISPMLPAEPRPPAAVVQCVAPAIILLVFLVAVPSMIYRRWQIQRRYRWTRERMQGLDRELKSLPRDFFATGTQGSYEAQAPVRRVQGPPIALLVVVFALAGLVCVNKYTDLKPLDSITSLLGIESALGGKAQTVAGRYDCHLEAENLGAVTQAEQTFSYVFHSDGTYTTYLEGSQQHSGTWSQSGNILTLNVPAIPGISAAYSFQATVSRDGRSFTSGKRRWIKVE